jgi:hypothetical protein
MLAYAREAAAKEGAALATLCGDMTDFRAEAPFAAAFNPLSSLRLLHSDAEVDAHLLRMADALAPRGVYVIDVAVGMREDEDHTTDEEWEMTSGDVTVRGANDAVTVREGGRERRLAWGAGPHLRAYTATAFRERVAACPAFAIESWHAEIARPTGVSEFALAGTPEPPATGRAMAVLRRL